MTQTTTVKKVEEFLAEIPEDILNKLNLKPGDDVQMSVENNSIIIHGKSSLEIDLDDFSKQDLQNILIYMNERNLTFNQFVEQTLTDIVNRYSDTATT